MRTHTKVSDSLSGVSWASDDQSVLTLWSSGGQLVQGDGLTTSLEDGGLGAGSELQSSDSSLRELEKSGVVGDGTNNNNGLLGSTLLLESSSNSRDRHRWLVDLGKVQQLEDHLVEWGVGSAWG